MKQLHSDMRQVHYVTFEYQDVNEKESHILEMTSNHYEILERFEDAHRVVYRKFFHE